MKSSYLNARPVFLIATLTLLLTGCGSPEVERDWDIPTDPQEKAAYDYAHNLKLPDSVPKPVPFDFTTAKLKALWPGTPSVSVQYFQHLCDTEAGEYIFKTVDKVEGLYQMRPRLKVTTDKFRDLYRMEDPYGYVEGETENVAFKFIGEHRYQYFEQPVPGAQFNPIRRNAYDSSLFLEPAAGDVVTYFEGYDNRHLNSLRKQYRQKRISQYSYTWRGIVRPRDRELGIAGGELLVLDLNSGELMGVRRGFAITSTRSDRTSWEFTPVCPRYEIRDRSKDFDFSYWFIRKVLRPVNPVEWPNVKF